MKPAEDEVREEEAEAEEVFRMETPEEMDLRLEEEAVRRVVGLLKGQLQAVGNHEITSHYLVLQRVAEKGVGKPPKGWAEARVEVAFGFMRDACWDVRVEKDKRVYIKPMPVPQGLDL